MALSKIPDTVEQNIELCTHALHGINIIFNQDKETKYRRVRLNSGQMATLLVKLSIFHFCDAHFNGDWVTFLTFYFGKPEGDAFPKNITAQL